MQNVHRWFEQYGRSHRNPTNKRIHWICVPLIYWSAYVLLSAIPTPWSKVHDYLQWGSVALILVQIYYFFLSPKLAVGLALFNALVIVITGGLSTNVPLPLWLLALGIFAAAWIGQFVGHRIEGAKPSFFEDLGFLLIGPAWLMGFIYKRLGLSY